MEQFAGTITLAELQELMDKAERDELRRSLMIAIPNDSPMWCQVVGGPKLRVVATRTGRRG